MERRFLLAADLPRKTATVGEDAARELGAQLGEQSGDRVERALVLTDPAAGKAAQEPDRVGMARVPEHLLGRAFLHEATRVEDADAVAHPPDDGEVVADEEDARAQLLAQPA